MVESVHLCCGYVLTTNNLQLGLQFTMCNYFMQQFSLQVAAVPIPSCVPGVPPAAARLAQCTQQPSISILGRAEAPMVGVRALLPAEL